MPHRTLLTRAATGVTLLAVLTACTGPSHPPAASTAHPPSTAAGTPAAVPSSGPTTGPTGGPTGTSTPGAAAGPGPAHTVIAVFENKAYDQVAGSAHAPWINTVIGSGVVFTDAHAITHPSQPNYLALFSGSTQQVTDDHCPVQLPGVPNLGQQLLSAGRSFTGYSEDLPSPGWHGCAHAGYAAKHNPWADFPDLPDATNQPLAAFPTDYSQLPTVSFVIPNLCHDMHDCPVATGDTWARDHLDGYLQWARQHNSVLILTFDEDDNSTSNHILTVIAGAGVHPGTYPVRVDHYTILCTVESWYGLPPLAHAADATATTGVWTGTT
jgi:phosphatidylinositol-3-phosphatase